MGMTRRLANPRRPSSRLLSGLAVCTIGVLTIAKPLSQVCVNFIHASRRSLGLSGIAGSATAETEDYDGVALAEPVATAAGAPTWGGSRRSFRFAGRQDEEPEDSSLLRRAVESGVAAYGIAALSAVFNGSFPTLARVPKEPLDPVLFNGIVCFGVFFSSLLVPLFTGNAFLFTPGGFFGGVLFVFAALFSFLAIPRCGQASAQAVWSVSAITVSFLWGVLGPAEIAAPLASLTWSVGSLVLLVAGALVIVSCDKIAAQLEGTAKEEAAEEEGEDKVTGLLFALAVGLFGGSVLVPFKFIPAEAAGLAALPSFGLGSAVAGALVTYGYQTTVKKESFPAVPGDAVGAGLASGLIWNLGNICSVVAQGPPFNLAYGIAYPILQCAMLFGGLWGIFIFKEIKGQSVNVFWAGAALLIAGVVVLSLYGPGTG
eukprot:TRINITY_DN10473_c0_g1_i2.p1 TRINITY_DN10473_c0_g1~~TRINITY_DN10473_c0_g1_i2.p1  ORF type:complete len:429 (+),score=85.48 TRINITY_DN10473_c0_g1_i2:131-1417(+)